MTLSWELVNMAQLPKIGRSRNGTSWGGCKFSKIILSSPQLPSVSNSVNRASRRLCGSSGTPALPSEQYTHQRSAGSNQTLKDSFNISVFYLKKRDVIICGDANKVNNHNNRLISILRHLAQLIQNTNCWK